MAGAAVMLRSVEGSEAIAASSGPVGQTFAELEFGLGEGPSVDAYALGQPVLVEDLGDPDLARWPGYTAGALKSGLRAVYAFPLLVGEAKFGVLTMFVRSARQPSRDDVSGCLAFAELAIEMLLDSSDSSVDGAIDPHLKSALNFRTEIYQAQGMVMASLRVRLPEALARMRAHAFSSGRELSDVSVDILEGRLQLTNDSSNNAGHNDGPD